MPSGSAPSGLSKRVARAAAAVLVTGGYWFLVLVGAERHEKAFRITQGGQERPMYTSVFLCVSAAGFAGDFVSGMCRSLLQAQLDVSPDILSDGTVPALPGPSGAGAGAGTGATTGADADELKLA